MNSLLNRTSCGRWTTALPVGTCRVHRLSTVPRQRYYTSAMSQAKARTALDELGTTGEFKRTDAGFRNWIEPDGKFAPEAGRYVLYVSLACPWACRCLAALHLKGLQDAIAVSVVHPTWQRTWPDTPGDEHCGWAFRSPTDPPLSSVTGHGSFDCRDCIPDPVNGAKSVRDLYELAQDTLGKYSVPVLWDTKHRTIVNNESSEIMRMFNNRFNHLAKNPGLDLYPNHLAAAIDEVNSWVYPTINNGVYRCGFATAQGPYEVAFKELFDALDRCEDILSKQRYIAGDQLTEADVRLFVTLIRFDEVYIVYFKCNKKAIREYPNLREYTKELYQMPAIRATVNMYHIKTHYFTSHPKLNTYAVVPGGSEPWWEQPHSRDSKL